MKTEAKNIFIRNGNWISWILLLGFIVTTEFGRIEIDFSWFSNVTVWINHFIVSYFGYVFSKGFLTWIKKERVQEIISFFFALFFSQTVHYSYDYIPSTLKQWVSLIFGVLLLFTALVLSGVLGYRGGVRKGIKQKIKREEQFNDFVKSATPDIKCQMANCERLIKKYPKEIEIITNFEPEFILEFMQKNRENKKK